MDLASLQNQTRIWLGQVLSRTLDDDLHISDLLQDGEILFEVSKVVWNLHRTQGMELECGPFVSKRSKGRYRPYCNVDSFLKVCKILGMNGIDLFSPSDVVEKRDIRKVCICIRALAKKARSKDLSVPDFDVVMYSIAMSTVMVGEIRRSLESSPCTTPSSHVSYKNSPRKRMLKLVSDDPSYEGSDEADSRYIGEKYFSSPRKSDSDLSSEQRESPEEYASDTSSSAILSGTNNMFNFILNADSQGKEGISGWGKMTEDDGMEVCSTIYTSSILGRTLNTELGDTFDADESSSSDVCSVEDEEDKLHRNVSMSPEVQKTEEMLEASSSVSSDSPKSEFPLEDGEVIDTEIPPCEDKINQATSCQGATCDELEIDIASSSAEYEKDETTQNLDMPVEHTTDTGTITNQAPSTRKSGRMTLLTTIAKGTAIAGVLFLLSNFRKSSGTNASQAKQPSEAPKTKESKLLPKKQQIGSRGKIYPAKKLKF